MQEIAIIIAFGLLAARHNQQILLRNYVDLIDLEPGNGDSDLIVILARALDIERWVIFILRGTARGFEQLEKAVKANSIPAIGCKIKTRHYKFSFKQFGSSPTPQMQRPACSFLEPFGPPTRKMGCAPKIARPKNHDRNIVSNIDHNKKKGRPDNPNGLALRLFQRGASVLFRSPPAGLIFPLNHRPSRALDEFLACICLCDGLCKWNQTLPNAFSNAVAPLQQYLPAVMTEPKNNLCRNYG
jgi:hypothetical protein